MKSEYVGLKNCNSVSDWTCVVLMMTVIGLFTGIPKQKPKLAHDWLLRRLQYWQQQKVQLRRKSHRNCEINLDLLDFIHLVVKVQWILCKNKYQRSYKRLEFLSENYQNSMKEIYPRAGLNKIRLSFRNYVTFLWPMSVL